MRHETVKKYRGLNWAGFDDALADFEARNSVCLHELLGQLANGVFEFTTFAEALKYPVVVDRQILRPLAEHVSERYKVWMTRGRIEWFANEREVNGPEGRGKDRRVGGNIHPT
jgi:hypothetical protein